jgi:aspartyl aminopeptidase
MRVRLFAGVLVLGALLLLRGSVTLAAQEPQPGPVWPKLSPSDQSVVMRFGEDFKAFMSRAKSSMTFVREATALVEANGFKAWPTSPSKAEVRPGSRWYAVNRDRSIAAFVIGTEPLSRGGRIVNTHNDAVHLTLKPKPFRESFDISLLDTLPHGGIKNYQWVNRTGDPVLLISDLSPHVDIDFRSRTNREVIQTEELDPILAATGQAAAQALKEKYGLTADDFLSADLQLVPTAAPVDVGLDRQLVAAYGHDDRSNGYAAFRAIVEVGTPQRTAIAYGVNNEEVSSWTTGVYSEWFPTLLAEIIAAQEPYSDLVLRRALRASQALVSDCTTAINPLFPQPFLPNGSARLGWGLVFKEYGPGRQADGEYFAEIRRIFTQAGVRWQTHAYRAGYGGSTIAQWFANANIDTIDVGVGLLSMHSPMDVSAKVDLWELYRGFKAFWGTASTASTR